MFLISDDYWQVQKTKHKGLGVFAKKKILKNTIISDYLGKVVKTADYDLGLDKKGLYLMYFSDQASIYPDLDKPGPHLINHSCTPNCWMYVYRGHTLFYATRNIEPGEEITIDYLLSPNDDHVCLCDGKNCTGKLHGPNSSRVENVGRRTKIIFGQYLLPLKNYPVLEL